MASEWPKSFWVAPVMTLRVGFIDERVDVAYDLGFPIGEIVLVIERTDVPSVGRVLDDWKRRRAVPPELRRTWATAVHRISENTEAIVGVEHDGVDIRVRLPQPIRLVKEFATIQLRPECVPAVEQAMAAQRAWTMMSPAARRAASSKNG